jgi:ectoine hydroxylase-related dioxygenase (phytanoyl-CoA dioxygenase family)
MSSNPGLIWLDESTAAEAIEEKLRLGAITGDEAENLRKFSRYGYLITKVDLGADAASEIDRDVDRLWREKPGNVTFAYDSPPLRFSASDEREHRRPRYRIHELHVASSVALRLVLDPLLHRYASLILGETAIATQSLYFEFGSQQALHRDSTVVPTPEFGRLVAAWIAIEDIAPESGPLAYVPGSQKFPFYELSPGEFVYDPSRHSGHDVEAAVEFYDEQLRRSGLPVRQFLARRGEVLVWHSALMHGGAPPLSPERTRKSLAIHYSTLRTQSTRLCAVREDGGESVFETAEILERGGAYAFLNPLEGRFLYRR